MNRKAAIVAATVLTAACFGAQAQTPAGGLRMDTGLYLGAGIGRSEARDLCQLTGGACDAKDVTWNIFAGYRLTRHFAVELGYSDFGDATTSGFINGVASRLKTSAKAVELVGLAILPLGDRFSIYGKLGAFRYDADGTATGGLVDSRSDKGTELTYGVGAEYNFNPQFGVRAEFQRYLDVGSGVIGLDKADITAVRAAGRYKF
jgi:opacity protein-like surface antigen